MEQQRLHLARRLSARYRLLGILGRLARDVAWLTGPGLRLRCVWKIRTDTTGRLSERRLSALAVSPDVSVARHAARAAAVLDGVLWLRDRERGDLRDCRVAGIGPRHGVGRPEAG